MKVTFINHSGEERTVTGTSGLSLVEIAIQHDVDGIEAECGGACSCGTCHVMVAEQWVDKLPKPGIAEDDMLGVLEEHRQSNSRLACQIVLTDDLDGLVVITPAEQFGL